MKNWNSLQVGGCVDGGFTRGLGLPMLFQRDHRKTSARSNPNSPADRYPRPGPHDRENKVTSQVDQQSCRGMGEEKCLTNARSENDKPRCLISGNCAFIEGSDMTTPLFSIVSFGSPKGAADTELKGLGPSRLEYPFVASLVHVSVRTTPCFHTFPASGWGILRWLATIDSLFQSRPYEPPRPPR